MKIVELLSSWNESECNDEPYLNDTHVLQTDSKPCIKVLSPLFPLAMKTKSVLLYGKREAYLNVRAYSSATTGNYICNGDNHKYEEIQINTVSLYICNNRISRYYKNRILSVSRSPLLRTHF